jgi:hypothetical protein
LCLALGVSHPDVLLKALTPRQWLDWIEYVSVEPIGDERADIRTAYASAGLASCWAENAEVEHFRVDWLKDPPKKLSLDERIRLVIASHNAREGAKRVK